MSSNIHLVLLVLMVTSRLVTIGSDGIPRRSRNADQQTQVTQVDANSVVTSAEMQGATPRTEKEVPSQSAKRFMGSSTTTSLPPQSAKELASDHSVELKESSSGDASKDKAAEKSVPDPSSTTQSALSSATTRPSRHISGAQNRDSKLMDLLAARRSALQRDRWRTHRRVVTTNRTTIETTSKSPPDSRTTCERNCTKNFTRRTTASCMRRCVSMKRLSNTTETTATPATVKPSARTKVDEKDNNEILLTDESSHGFYVVTKELNDTANHITNGVKVPATSTEKTYKIRMKGRQPISDEEIDLKPYVFFGQKLPPLKPTVLRITKVSDDHPKILEVSVTRPSERIRSRGRLTPRDRNIVASTRRHAFNNFTRGLTTTSTDRPFGLFKESSEERLIKEATLEDDSTVTVLVRSPQRHSARLQMPYGNASSSILGAHNNSNFQVKNFTSVTLILEASSTPLMISVPEEDDPTERPTIEIPISAVGVESVESPTINTTLPNVVYNVTSPSTIIAHSPSSSLGTIPNPTTTTSTSTTTSTTPSTTSTTATTTSTAPSTTTTATTTTTTFPSTTTMPTTASTTTASTTSAAIKSETVTPSSSTIAAPLEPPSDFPSPTTTISSSIRSTVNPISTSTLKTANIATTNSSKDASLNRSTTVDYFSSTENSTYRTNTSFDFNTPIRQNNQTSKTPAIEGIILTENEVTIEMHRINTATYVMAGLGMLPVAIIILYVGKTVIMKRRFKDDDDLDNYVTDQQPISPVRKMDQCDEERNDQYSIISDQEFDRTNIRFKSLLGEGNFGQVWKAEADDLSGHLGTTRIVAVKTVRAGSSQVGLKEEAEIMRKLGSHPNVVTLLGACVETEPHLLIMEYAMRGRLLSLLRAARSATNILPASVPGGRSLAPLSPRTLAGFSLDIARGMEYISGKKIVHRDLAARNVLLDHNGVCKICDFGMSIDLEAVRKTQPQTRKAETRNLHGFERFRFDIGGRLINQWNHANNNISNNNNSNNNNHNQEKKHHDSISKRPALPIRWMAPEALQYHMFSTETDVWAFGIVLWEIATLGCTPYPNLSGREVVRCVPNGVRPELPKEGRPEFYNLMGRCWHKEPRLRPTFREARIEISRTICKWVDDDTATSDYMDVSGFSEDLEHGMVYFNRRISEFECEI